MSNYFDEVIYSDTGITVLRLRDVGDDYVSETIVLRLSWADIRKIIQGATECTCLKD